MLAQFVMSADVDVQAFNDKLNLDDWERAGFAATVAAQKQRQTRQPDAPSSLEDRCQGERRNF